MAEKSYINPREVSWRAAEYDFLEKGPGWYGVISIATIALLIFAFLQRNFFFAVFVLLAGIMLMFFGKSRPAVFDFKVNEKGVGVGRNFYEYESFKNFALRKRPGKLDEIILQRTKIVNPFLRIPVDSETAKKVIETVKRKLPEIEHKESLVTLFSEWLGF